MVTDTLNVAIKTEAQLRKFIACYGLEILRLISVGDGTFDVTIRGDRQQVDLLVIATDN